MILSGADIVCAVLAEQRVDTIFGYPGGNVLALYGALSRCGLPRHVLTASEAGAAHAADGYARATGRVGVCIATSGPGATNLVTGIATAYMDSSPVVFITGNVPTSQIGTDSFQEVDITGITQPITKHNVMVKDVTRLAASLRFAFAVAQSGRRGPVLVDIPSDVQRAECEYDAVVPLGDAPQQPSEGELAAAAALINASQNPVILAGGGCVDAAPQLKHFAETLGCPVAMTLMGLGAFPSGHAQSVGLAGMYGTSAAHAAIAESDLVIAVGTRFSDRVAAAEAGAQRPVLHIDLDRSEINKNVPSRAFITGDASVTLEALTGMVTRRVAVAAAEPSPMLNAVPFYVLSRVRRHFGDALITTDVGDHQMWAAQAIAFDRPRSLITSGGFGTMGFGLGAAIGACLATGCRVVHVTGDGSFMMNQNELMTAVREHLPITTLVLRNGQLDMVRGQQRGLGYNLATSLDALPDICALARSYGAAALSIVNPADADEVLRTAASLDTPCVVDVDISGSPPPQTVGQITWSDERTGKDNDKH